MTRGPDRGPPCPAPNFGIQTHTCLVGNGFLQVAVLIWVQISCIEISFGCWDPWSSFSRLHFIHKEICEFLSLRDA